MVALAVLAVKQVRVVSAATELQERLALRVALAEPAELLEHRVAVEMAGLQEQAEPAAPAELVVRMVLQALPAMVVTAALAELAVPVFPVAPVVLAVVAEMHRLVALPAMVVTAALAVLGTTEPMRCQASRR